MRTLRPYSLAMAGATLAVALSVSAMTANAASTFLLQFGQHDTESAAREQWDGLQSAHPDLLSDLSLRVAPITTASGSETYRTQASGVDNREDAQSTCNTLNAQNVTCMIVETSMYLPEDRTVDASDVEVEMVSDEMDAVTLEAQPQLVQVQEPKPASKRSFFLPWLNDDAEEEVTEEAASAEPVAAASTQAAPVTQVTAAPQVPKAPPRPERVEQPAQPKPIDRAAAASMSADLAPGETRAVASRAPRNLNAQHAEPQQPAPAPQPDLQPQVATGTGAAQVEVAEAIQVPLSFDEIVTPAAPTNRPVGYGGYPSQPQPKNTTWIQLSHFASKEAAMSYWRTLSSQKPELMRLLRVRIIAPFSNRYGNARTSLRMGPFSEQAEIDALCQTAAQQKLRCTAVQEVGNSSTAAAGRRPYNPAEHYNRRQATSRSYSRTAGARPSGMFWVQLGAFDTVEAAQQRWSQLKTVHSDALGRMQPQVSYPALSSSPKPVYHLRTGPFVTQDSAARLCNNLQARHLGCVIVQAR